MAQDVGASMLGRQWCKPSLANQATTASSSSFPPPPPTPPARPATPVLPGDGTGLKTDSLSPLDSLSTHPMQHHPICTATTITASTTIPELCKLIQ
ncbi:hypothetical protein IAQ61_003720 [Plenodomus lingam]|uniref:uncharacterized protein n=1 Tax=Leptosphaeria maculans TaxID=5022 RepID=UPI0033204569|nr:hypothetical protein IAQ61_003720 [Plenodomus lingam]